MAKKKVESIWTKDITPSIINFMTADITPDFTNEVWTKDITHMVVGSLAVFGLVVSSLVTTAGVASLGVNVELAFAQQQAIATTQTAALALAEENHQAPTPAMVNGSTTIPRPPKMDDRMDSSTDGHSMVGVGNNLPISCTPLLVARTLKRGISGDDVTKLQNQLLSEGLLGSSSVTGFFGPLTEKAVGKWQMGQGIASSSEPDANKGIGMVGPRTRAVFAKCEGRIGQLLSNGRKSPDFDHGSSTMGSSTKPHRDDMMGSTTEHHEKLPPPPPAPPAPTSYRNNSSNAASILEAVAEISDGYSKFLVAALGLVGVR